MNTFACCLPVNSVSFGQVSIAILRNIYRRGLAPCLFPIGNVDLTAQKPDNEFFLWLQSCLNKSVKLHNRKNPTIKLWHLNGMLDSFSEQQIGITFLETDQISDIELNVIKNQKILFVTSNFTREIMENYGANNVKYLPLGFDKDNFYKTNKTYLNSDIVCWSIWGKCEPVRKRHEKIIRSWVKKYGNDKKHMLHLNIYNCFISPEDNNKLLNNILEGKRYWNVNPLPYMKTNAEYNDSINSSNIVIGLSGGEGRDLPVYHSVGLGKHCIGLNAHAYLDYLNDENAVLVNPSSKIRAVDGMFFHEGSPWNTGNFFDWDENEFLDKCEIVLEKYKNNPINEKGLELQKITYDTTVDLILKEMDLD